MSQEAYDLLARRLGLTSEEAAAALLDLGDTGEDDFHDNFAHEQAKLEASRLTTQEADLRLILKYAEVIPPNTNTSAVGIGNTVRIRFEGEAESETVTLMGTADVLANVPNHISEFSALGQAILGAAPGSKVTYEVQESKNLFASTVVVEEILPGQFSPPRNT